MENNKALTADQLNKLKETVRQRFDDLYQRIGTNRQKLATTVLLVDQSINKELTKEKIDISHEKEILRRLRDIEKVANNQLPHVHKISAPGPSVSKIPAVKAPAKTPSVKAPSAKAPATKVKTETKTKAKPKKK